MAMTTITINLEETLKEAANNQLVNYGTTLQAKLEKIIQEYAIEYRKSVASTQLKKEIDDSIFTDDLIINR